ncbi:MAG: hypothetical protein LBU65_13225 [Planctomycetaceae bacterium]|nr:hypothetical protein [Planctomycetaceae bacterium]
MKQPLIDANAFLHEKMEALLQEFDQVGDAAPIGQVLNHLDAFLFANGRKFLTEFLGTSSYRLAAEMLEEFGCFHLSHQTVGDVAVEVADEIETKLKDNSAVRKDFQKAKGDTEFTTDGAFVNTRRADGEHEWREMKVAIVAKRERGAGALPEEWDSRDLPEPTVSIAAAAIESRPEFQECCKNLRRSGLDGLRRYGWCYCKRALPSPLLRQMETLLEHRKIPTNVLHTITRNIV